MFVMEKIYLIEITFIKNKNALKILTRKLFIEDFKKEKNLIKTRVL